MKWLAFLALTLVAHAATPTEIARAAAEEFARGDVEAYAKRVAPECCEPSDPAQLRKDWQPDVTRRLYGDFVRTGDAACHPNEDRGEGWPEAGKYQICFVPIFRTRAKTTAELWIDSQGRIYSGIHSAYELLEPRRMVFGIPALPLPIWFPAAAFFGLALIAWSLHVLPAAMSKRGLFFGVSPAEQFASSHEGRSILRSYRRWNAALVAIPLAAAFADIWIRSGWLLLLGVVYFWGIATVTYHYVMRGWMLRMTAAHAPAAEDLT